MYIHPEQFNSIILVIGSNDILSHTSMDSCFKDLHELIGIVKRLFVNASVSFVSILPKTRNYNNKFVIPRIYALNSYAKHLSVMENIKYINLFWNYISL